MSYIFLIWYKGLISQYFGDIKLRLIPVILLAFSRKLTSRSQSHGKSGKVMEKIVVMESDGKVMENDRNMKSHGKVKNLP